MSDVNKISYDTMGANTDCVESGDPERKDSREAYDGTTATTWPDSHFFLFVCDRSLTHLLLPTDGRIAARLLMVAVDRPEVAAKADALEHPEFPSKLGSHGTQLRHRRNKGHVHETC